MKKTVLLFTAALAACSLLYAGGRRQDAASVGGEAPMELSFGFWWNAGGPFGGDPVGKYIEEKFNVKITKIMQDWSDYTDKIRLWAATDELPDLFSAYPAGATWFGDFIFQEVIRSIPREMIDRRPNIRTLTDAHTLGRQLTDFYQGQYFIVRPESVKNWKIANQNGLYYRRDWAEKLGIGKPTNMDELYEYLRAVVNNDPDGNGIRDTYGLTDGGVGAYFYPFGAFEADWIYLPNGKVQPGYLDEEPMVAALTWLRKIFKEGLLDPEFPKDYTVLQAKFYQNHGAMIRSLTPDWAYTIVGREFAEAHPEIANPYGAVGAIAPLAARAGATPYWSTQSETCGTLFPYDLPDEKLDKILEIYDWMLGREGKDLAHWGIRDVDYSVNADGSYRAITDPNDRLTKNYTSSDCWWLLPDWDYDWFEENPALPDAARQWAIDEWLSPSNAAAGNIKPLVYEFAKFAVTEEKSLFTFDFGVAYIEIVTGDGDVRTMYRQMIQEARNQGLDAVIESVNRALGL
jgi:ABC-type glycerol-3-phosphate transport system substrate-binding protein